MRAAALLAMLLLAPAATAGLHVTVESFLELPSDWRGFLPDHRALRLAASAATAPGVRAGPLRDMYADAASRLESEARSRPLTADEEADLGGLYVRLGEPAKALERLRRSAREHPNHFRTFANLGTAWQLAGELGHAAAALEEAVRLAPDHLREDERLHLRLVRERARSGPRGLSEPDRLFDGELPPEALARVQRLALWLPADGMLLWQLGELAHRLRDDRAAANILDGCAAEFGMTHPAIQERRRAFRVAAEAHEARAGHGAGPIAFRSHRPLARTFDPARLPAIRPDCVNPLPWAALAETRVGRGFRPEYVPHVEQLEGLRVSLVGYPAPAAGADGFLLVEYPIGCWFCETPGPAQVIAVGPAAGADPPARGPVKVVGKLRLNRIDPERHLFALEGAIIGEAD